VSEELREYDRNLTSLWPVKCAICGCYKCDAIQHIPGIEKALPVHAACVERLR